MAHWLVASVSRFYILGVSIETDDICLKELLLPTEMHSTRGYSGGPTLFVTAAGLLSLFWLEVGGLVLEIWTEADDGAWTYIRAIKLTTPKNWDPLFVHVWSGEKSGMLIIIDTFRCMHMVDVETGVTKDVRDKLQNGWGMMADWPALFMSRLGGG
jgi:hypothetical protein